MSIPYHPEQGTILICDFKGFIDPEMVKRRPVVVVSPRLRQRGKLCAVVPLSTTAPSQIMPYHYKLHTDPELPDPYSAKSHWVKADMIYTVSFDRLSLRFKGKDLSGKRIYDVRIIDKIAAEHIKSPDFSRFFNRENGNIAGNAIGNFAYFLLLTLFCYGLFLT